MSLNRNQQSQLNQMKIGNPYKEYEVGDGRIMKSLVDKGYVTFVDFYESLPIIMCGYYTPWKYGKTFTRVK